MLSETKHPLHLVLYQTDAKEFFAEFILSEANVLRMTKCIVSNFG